MTTSMTSSMTSNMTSNIISSLTSTTTNTPTPSTDSIVDSIITPMEPSKTQEFIIRHEIKELGIHNLVCTLQYVAANEGIKRLFRKYYRFQVFNPFAVKTKANNMGDGTVFLEVQIQNVSERYMYLERMNFEPGEIFNYQDLNYNDNNIDDGGENDEFGEFMSGSNIDNEDNNIFNQNKQNENNKINDNQEENKEENIKKNIESVFGNNSYLNPQDIRQYLYMLKPKPEIDDRLGRTANALGKLDIIWRSHLGETGRLQTSQLTRKSPILDEIELSVISIPSIIQLEIPFKLGCRIRNRTTSTIKVIISAIKNKMGSILLSGQSSEMLGEIISDGIIEFELEFFPLSPGLQRVGGLKLTDIISGYTKEFDHLTDVFVVFL
ncbi:2851_t:CDS:2 [Diversispora eburnea]|uniref:2851_t:CDS:1 n=1 Tax=Diversispora eburnea TaxID=1213867 RepID=A0A9N9F3M8_9GLOM|nr:2851_t:CDS:2 [Diversispora eburnea]